MAQLGIKIATDYSEVVRLRQEVQRLGEDIRRFRGSSDDFRFRQMADEFEKASGRYRAKMGELTSEVTGLASSSGGAFGSFTSEIDASEKATGRLSRAFGAFFEQYTAASLALKGFNIVTGEIQKAGATIMDFQAKNSMLGAILGETDESMKDMIDQAKELGRTTVFTASQVTQLQIELSKLGFEKPAIQDMTQSILSFAQATGGDLGDAAALTGAAVRMFGASTEEANRYTNAMARATTASALDFRSIRDNLATFGPMAHSIGLSIEDTLALFGTLKNAGIEGSTAMTSLRNIFTKVAQGKIPGMEGGVKTLDEFVAKLKEMGELDPGKSMKMIGPRGGTQFMTLMQQADTILELRDKIAQASQQDTTSGMAERMTSNVSGAMAMMKSAWEGFILSFSESTGPWKDVIDMITSGITAVTNLISDGGTVSMSVIRGVMSAIGGLAAAFAVKNGIAAVTAKLTEIQIYRYKQLGAALEQALAVEVADYDQRLSSLVLSGKLTQADASRITVLMNRAKAELASLQTEQTKLQTKRAAIAADIQYAESQMELATAEEKVIWAEMRKNLVTEEGVVTTRIASAAAKQEALAHQINTGEKAMETGATWSLKGAMDALGLSMLANPWVWLAAVIAAVGYVTWELATKTDEATLAQQTLAGSMEELNKQVSDRQSKARQLIADMNDETKTAYQQHEAYKKLVETYKDLAKYSPERLKGMSQDEINAIINAEDERAMMDSMDKQRQAYIELSDFFNAPHLRGRMNMSLSGDKRIQDELEYVRQKYGVDAKTLLDEQDWTLNLHDYFSSLADQSAKTYSDKLSDRMGFYLSDAKGKAEKAVSDYGRTLSDTVTDSLREYSQNRMNGGSGGDVPEKMADMVKEAEKHVRELKEQMEAASGDRKASIELEITDTQNALEFAKTAKEMMDRGEDIPVDVVINVLKGEDEMSGDVAERISKAYDDAQASVENFLTAYDNTNREVSRMSEAGVNDVDAYRDSLLSLEEYAEALDAPYRDAQQELERLEKKLRDAKTTAEKNRIRADIEGVQDALSDIETLRKAIADAFRDPTKIKVLVDYVQGSMPTMPAAPAGQPGTFQWGQGGQGWTPVSKPLPILGHRQRVQHSSRPTDTTDTPTDTSAAPEEDKQKREQAAKDALDRRRRLLEMERKEREQAEKERREAERAAADARIAQISDNAEREEAMRREKHRRVMEDLDVQTGELIKKNYENAKKRWEAENKNAKTLFEDTHDIKDYSLTADQQRAINAKRTVEESEYRRKGEELRKKELDAMYAYLKEYGDIEQKRLAITEEYAAKIVEARTAGEKASLTMRRDDELRQLGSESVMERIDWDGVFSSLEGHTKGYLQSLRDQLQGLLDSGEISDITQMQTITDKIHEIDDAMREYQGALEFAGDRQREHNRLVERSAEAQVRLAKTQSDEAKAAGELVSTQERARKQTGMDGAVTSDRVREMMEGMDVTSPEYEAMKSILSSLILSEGKLAEARRRTAKATDEAKAAEDASKRTSSQAVADWFSDAQQFIAEKGIDQIPQLLDEIGLGEIGERVSMGLSGFGKASAAAEDFAKGNWIGALTNGIGAIKDFGSALSLGGGNASDVAKTTERLTEANQKLADRIADLTEAIGNSAGQKAISAFEAALQAQKEMQDNNMEILRAQMGYHNAHHSNEYYADDAVIAGYNEAAQRAFKAARLSKDEQATQITGLGSIYNLTPEQLKAIKDYASGLWEYLTEIGKYDKSEYWEQVVEQAGAVEALTERINNNLTQTSFDSLRGSFLDALTDMESSSADFAQSFEDMMFKAVMNSMVLDDKFDEWLEDWQKRYAAAVKGGDMGSLARLRDEASAMRDQKVAERDMIAETMGYGDYSEAKASSGGFKTMSQDTADALNGRMTAIQMSVERIGMGQEAMMGVLTATAAQMTATGTSATSAIGELQRVMAENYVEVRNIRENTDSMVKPIKEMGEMMVKWDQKIMSL